MSEYDVEYEIQIHYWTGDSFSTEDRETSLDGTWKNIDIIKENISRIKEQYELSLNIKLDNGKEYLLSAFWCGYFEGLYGVRVIKAKDQTESIGFGY
jgi:hypothetical protein